MSNSNISTASATTTAQVVSGRTRLVGVYFTQTSTAAQLQFRSGGASGSLLLTLNSSAVANSQFIPISNLGILFDDGIHVTFSSAGIPFVTVFFYGGKAT